MTDADLAILAGRLKSVMSQDAHQVGGSYEIRSLYFDDIRDRCMEENEAGVDLREKYRIRIYDACSDVIRLEIKEKNRGLTRKTSCSLSRQECLQLMEGNLPLSLDHRAALNRLQIQRRCFRMEPKAIISYERTAFVHPSGNVRITFDRNIMASRSLGEFLEDRVCAMVPVLPAGVHVLEVKYDEFLPDVIAQMLETGKLRQTAFSKYYLGRLALEGCFPAEETAFLYRELKRNREGEVCTAAEYADASF